MEEDGLIHRKVYAEVPPKVEYSLTDAGVSLNEALRPLGEWGRVRLRREGHRGRGRSSCARADNLLT